MKLQSALRMIYPSQCLTCGAAVEDDLSLCGECWRETHFIHGLTCRTCGVPLPGEDRLADVQCDDCMTIARPWHRGAAAMMYRGKGRQMVLRLKHGDRTDLARPAAHWMARVAPPVASDALVVPVPLHWLRQLKRRYNQSALMAKIVSQRLGLTYLPDALHRPKATEVLDGKSRDTRFAALDGAILPHPKRALLLQDRPVLLIDDVMTSGATLAACTEACISAGARQVDVLVLARVAKDD
ncbi:ComF family protein [Litoreibacter arenae]|uniref:Competence protein n=1 Tax=Litoreibacter arenae DSM 19593 TaxID=1123360 RepID=S9RUQ6_9RHOB|nr:ComF family protein [Litoreibacter arenae]EPX77654.1 Competence protein [Litoreibacter arenae DSM 19593]